MIFHSLTVVYAYKVRNFIQPISSFERFPLYSSIRQICMRLAKRMVRLGRCDNMVFGGEKGMAFQYMKCVMWSPLRKVTEQKLLFCRNCHFTIFTQYSSFRFAFYLASIATFQLTPKIISYTYSPFFCFCREAFSSN